MIGANGLLLLGLGSAQAAEPEQLFLVSEEVAVGIHPSGTLGNPAQELGLLWDPDSSASDIPVGGDLLWVGDPFEIWTLEMRQGSEEWILGGRGESEQAESSDTEPLELSWSEITEASTLSIVEASGTHELLTLQTRLLLSWTDPVLWIDMEIQAHADIEDVWLSRAFDPDPDAWLGSGFGSTNQAGEGWAMGSGDWDGRTLALAGPGVGGICAWCTRSSEILAGSAESRGDDQLGLTMEIGDLAAGETVEIRLAYALAMNADEALSLALLAVDSRDRDGDGYEDFNGDCDDIEALVHPEAFEAADGIDNDCDGEIDELDGGSSDTGESSLDPLPSDQSWTWTEESPGGCATTGAHSTSPLGLLLLGLLIRRRGEP